MRAPHIPDSILGVTRKLTSSEIAIYNIDCGKHGNLSEKNDTFSSNYIDLSGYVFKMTSCAMNEEQLYTLTILRKVSGGFKKLSKTRRIRR
jgi:hypothetical protein